MFIQCLDNYLETESSRKGQVSLRLSFEILIFFHIGTKMITNFGGHFL